LGREGKSDRVWCYCRLEIAYDFAAGAAAKGMPSAQLDVVADEAHRAVGEQQIDAAGMAAAGRPPIVVQRDAVPQGRVGWVTVVVERAVHIAVRPLAAAVGLPGIAVLLTGCRLGRAHVWAHRYWLRTEEVHQRSLKRARRAAEGRTAQPEEGLGHE